MTLRLASIGRNNLGRGYTPTHYTHNEALPGTSTLKVTATYCAADFQASLLAQLHERVALCGLGYYNVYFMFEAKKAVMFVD